MRVSRIVFAWLIAAVLLLNLALPSSAAEDAGGAAIAENILTSVAIHDENGADIQTVRPEMGARVQVDYTWKLPAGHGYTAGAAFTFALPDKFKTDRELTGDLDGGVGTYLVTPEGQVTFTFNDSIENEELTGTFYVWRQFDESKFTGSTSQPIDFEYDGSALATILVHFKSAANGNIAKTGAANKPMNAGSIDWTVQFNMKEDAIDNAVMTDKLPAGLEIALASIKVYKLDVQLDGSTVRGAAVAPTVNVLSPTEFNLGFGDIDGAYQVEYTTTITGANNATYTNGVEVTGDGYTPLNASASVQAKYSQPLDKKSTSYDAATQTVGWSIPFNYNEQPIAQADAMLTDTFGDKDLLVPGSLNVVPMSIAADGSASSSGAPLAEGTDYTVTSDDANGTFTLKFLHEIGSAYEIAYKTTSKDRVYTGRTVTNTVEFGALTKTATRVLQEVIFKKNNGHVDFKNKTISWSMNLNQDNKTMDHVVITDTYAASQGLTFLPGSLKIGSLAEGTDYTVAPSPDYGSGFVLTFLNPITSSQTITYTTKFDSTVIQPQHLNQYANKAKLEWEEGGTAQTPLTKTAVAGLDSYSKDNGSKTGTYDATTKEITWTVDVNYNLYDLAKAVVQDFYTGEMNLVPDSLKVYHLNLSGGSNGASVGDLVDPPYDVDDSVTKGGNSGFKLKLGPIDSAYRITYKTSLQGKPVKASYSNDATLFDEATPDTLLFGKSAVVSPKYGNEFIHKTGRQGTGADQDYAYWTVDVNRSQSHIEAGSQLTDTLSSNQVLVADSFKLFDTTVDASGNLTKAGQVDASAYTVDVQDNSFTLTFANALDKSYILEYKSYLNADDGETVNNQADFAGHSSGTIGQSQQSDVRVSLSGAGGGASAPGKGDLTIVKVDAADPSKTLAGAVFALYDKTGTILIATQTTDDEGKAVFGSIRYKDYVLKELTAPSGYLIDDAYKSGQAVALTSSSGPITVADTKGIWDFELTKLDADTSEPIEGTVFKMQAKNGADYEDVDGFDRLTTDAQGKLYLPKLTPGDYRLIETEATRGYKLDSTPIPFTIDSSQSATKKAIAKNERNVGSARLVKTDTYDGAPLAGAVFELQDENGLKLQENLSTEADGTLLVENLKSGLYKLVETAAPADYVLDAKPIEFEIVNDGETVRVAMTNLKTPGSATLTKVSSSSPDTKLSGAAFRLLDDAKKPAKDNAGNPIADLTTDDNGRLHVADLRPGTYYFQEFAAPAGYILNPEYIKVEVSQAKDTAITVNNSPYIYIPPLPPTTPTEPTTPVDPTEPTTPVDPSEPTTPSEPSEPAGPDNPTTPPKDKPDSSIKRVMTKQNAAVKGKVSLPKKAKPTVSSKPKHGSVAVDANGSWTYKPNKGYTGRDSFAIAGGDEVAEVVVDVLPADSAAGAGGSDGAGRLPKTGETTPLMTIFGYALAIAALSALAGRWIYRRRLSK